MTTFIPGEEVFVIDLKTRVVGPFYDIHHAIEFGHKHIVEPEWTIARRRITYTAIQRPSDETKEALREPIHERFLRFHYANPNVYDYLVTLARRAKSLGHNKLAIGMLWERLRWEMYVEWPQDAQAEFKLNDHYRSRYARLMMTEEKDLVGFFEVRRLRSP